MRSPLSGAEVWNGYWVEGCSRTFASDVWWRLVSLSGEVLASGFTMGDAADGPAPFYFVVEYEVDRRQEAHLEVYAMQVDGGGLLQPPAVVPLVLEADE